MTLLDGEVGAATLVEVAENETNAGAATLAEVADVHAVSEVAASKGNAQVSRPTSGNTSARKSPD